MSIYNSGNELGNIYFKGDPIKEIYSEGNKIYTVTNFTLVAGTSTFTGGAINGFRNGGSQPNFGNFGSLTPNTLSETTIVQIFTDPEIQHTYLYIEPILTFSSIKIIQQDNGFVLGDFEYSNFAITNNGMYHEIDTNTQQFINGKVYSIIFTLN